jgi:hypothetical protein
MNRISIQMQTRLTRTDNIGLCQPSLAKLFNTPKGIRIPVTSVKGRCPRPLDDGGLLQSTITKVTTYSINVNT